MRLILQSVLLPNEVCQKRELYYQANRILEQKDGMIKLHSKDVFSTRAYMNLFDGAVWVKYTNENNFNLEIEFIGSVEIKMYSWSNKKEQLISTNAIENLEMKKCNLKVALHDEEMTYFKIRAIGEVKIKQMRYVLPAIKEQLNDVHLSVIICTYKRKQQVMENIGKLKNSLFFNQNSKYYQKMSVRIVDNASELKISNEAYFKMFHNANTGGAGGFTRGILESRNDIKQYEISHVVFMDDDVEFINETFYRLYALLCLVRKQYKDNPIAGRMFSMRQREIQYTASEIWNKGDLRHIGHNQDMSKDTKLLSMNKKLGEYSGWWLACFPIEFVNHNLPLPFFIHCDDVEYGLRCGKKPLLLNGVQVWHETYENRQDSTILYYDIRNLIITNVVTGQYTTPNEVIKSFNRKVLYSLKARRFADSYVMTVAFKDYLKGATFFVEKQSKKVIGAHSMAMNLLHAIVMFGLLQIENIAKGNKAFCSFIQLVKTSRKGKLT